MDKKYWISYPTFKGNNWWENEYFDSLKEAQEFLSNKINELNMYSLEFCDNGYGYQCPYLIVENIKLQYMGIDKGLHIEEKVTCERDTYYKMQ